MNPFWKIIGNWVLPILSIISAGICSYALCKYTPREHLGFDYIGAVIGILALLTTFLVGWHILNAIEANRIVKQATTAETKFDTLANELQQQISQNRIENEANMFFNMAHHMVNNSNILKQVDDLNTCYSYSCAYDGYFNAFKRYVDANSYNRYLDVCLGQMELCLQILGNLKFAKCYFDSCNEIYASIIYGANSLDDSIKKKLEELHKTRIEMGINEDNKEVVANF